MAGRKLILVGDSIMRLHFHSLACLMRSQVRKGKNFFCTMNIYRQHHGPALPFIGLPQPQPGAQEHFCLPLVTHLHLPSPAAHVW